MTTTTTSLRLPDELKSRVADAAQRAQKSAHAFMLEAIWRHVEQVESEATFLQGALDSLAEVQGGGATFDADQVHAWLIAKVRGEGAPTPRRIPAARRAALPRR